MYDGSFSAPPYIEQNVSTIRNDVDVDDDFTLPITCIVCFVTSIHYPPSQRGVVQAKIPVAFDPTLSTEKVNALSIFLNGSMSQTSM